MGVSQKSLAHILSPFFYQIQADYRCKMLEKLRLTFGGCSPGLHHLPIDSAKLQSMSAIERLTRVLFHICHTRYLAFMKCRSRLADF